MITANTSFGAPDPDLKFTNYTALIALLNTLVDTEIPDDVTPYVVSVTTPVVDDQDKVWHKIDGNGRPLGTFLFYAGAWRKEYEGNQDEVRMFVGDPTVHFESNGVGKIGGDWDGWALLDGQGGRDNLSNLTPIGGQMDNVGFTGFSGGVWRTSVTGAPLSGGGAAEVTLDDPTTFRPATSAITVGKWSATGNTGATDGGLLGLPPGAGGTVDLAGADAGNTTPDPISVVQPFRAVALAKWVGYA